VSSIAGLTDRGTVAAYAIVNTTTLSGRNYTTSRDVTLGPVTRLLSWSSGDLRCVLEPTKF
jgi:hypothetical protein